MYEQLGIVYEHRWVANFEPQAVWPTHLSICRLDGRSMLLPWGELGRVFSDLLRSMWQDKVPPIVINPIVFYVPSTFSTFSIVDTDDSIDRKPYVKYIPSIKKTGSRTRLNSSRDSWIVSMRTRMLLRWSLSQSQRNTRRNTRIWETIFPLSPRCSY